MESGLAFVFQPVAYLRRDTFRAPASTNHVVCCSRLPLRRTVSCCTATPISNMARLRLEIETVAGAERGLFGQEEEERDALEAIIQAVEEENPTPNPTADNAAATAGTWRLLYTNLQILGRRRVKLAIGTSQKSGFIKLGEFLQVVEPGRRESRSIVEFKILTGGTGTFTIVAEYEVESGRRVQVKTTGTQLEPPMLEKLVGENRGLLVEIFNPEGYLDITYVDEAMRIGRDNKGHVFVLERVREGDDERSS